MLTGKRQHPAPALPTAISVSILPLSTPTPPTHTPITWLPTTVSVSTVSECALMVFTSAPSARLYTTIWPPSQPHQTRPALYTMLFTAACGVWKCGTWGGG